jgi:hypothetical protein
MSEEFDNDTHEELIKAIIAYCRWNDRFERYGYIGSSVEAREALRTVREMATKRRIEILSKRKELIGKTKTKDEDSD